MLSKSKCHGNLLGRRCVRWHGKRVVEPGAQVPVGEQIHPQQRHQIRSSRWTGRVYCNRTATNDRTGSGPQLLVACNS